MCKVFCGLTQTLLKVEETQILSVVIRHIFGVVTVEWPFRSKC